MKAAAPIAKLWSVGRVKPCPTNPRKITEQAVAAVAGSIKAFGFRQPIVVDAAGVIITGHTRLRAAISLGMKQVPVVKAADLTPEQVRAYRLADNRVAEFSEWDRAMLVAELGEPMTDIEFASFDQLLKELPIDSAGSESVGDANAAPKLEQGRPCSQRGMVYRLGTHHRLLCGDATAADDVAALMSGQLAGLVFTDPPYGVAFQSGMSEGGTATRFDKLANDDRILDIAPIIHAQMADDTAAFVWTSHHVYPQWREQFASFYKQTIIWYKGGGGIGDLAGSYANDYEMALLCTKGRPTLRGTRGAAVWPIAKDGATSYVHPTQKPVELAERAMVDFSDHGDLVLDLFGGSGSTLIAAARKQRRAYLMELSEHYCDVIRRRWTTFATANGIDPGTGALEPADG